jgi:hypothetical protein
MGSILGFWCSRVRGALGGISSIPLDLASFGGQNLGYWTIHEMFLLSPKSCANPWSDSGVRELDLGELTHGCCSSRELMSHHSDR